MGLFIWRLHSLTQCGKLLYSFFRDSGDKTITDTTTSASGYQEGELLRTGKVQSAQFTSLGILALPQHVLSSSCLTSPVRYLENIDSQCSYQMSEALCNRGSALSAFSYVMASTITKPSCPEAFSILQVPASRIQDANIAPTIVNYHCATDPAPYIRSLGGSVPPQELPPRCSFDDGFTLPTAPSHVAGICEDAVLDVQYRVLWSGIRVVQLNATIIMGNVPLLQGTTPSVLTPSYRTTFVHDYTPQNDTLQDNYLASETAYERSGRRGELYMLGQQILMV